tara:strand:+ start:551 stop:733 length:183 start_codon:yes stop_codon:yes gene_type:complete
MIQKAKIREQIADEYGFSAKTLFSWIKNRNLSIDNCFLTLAEQKNIYEAFGLPTIGNKKV